MKIKTIPEDFIVEEVFNLESLDPKEQGSYHYFLFEKREYSQIRAIDQLARKLQVQSRGIHYCGTKDKKALTRQLISVRGSKEKLLERIQEFNTEEQDLNLEYLASGEERVNLGIHEKNKFILTLRELSEEDCRTIKEKIEEIKKEGVLNLFDDQRFGYAQTSDLIGRALLKKDLKEALLLILSSCPKEPTEDLKLFTDKVKENWENVLEGDKEKTQELRDELPKHMREMTYVLGHLKREHTDLYGAFRELPKKLRTLYVHAYQSRIFNKILLSMNEEELKEIPELELIQEHSEFPDSIKKRLEEFLKEDELSQEDFKLSSLPELKPAFKVKRKVKLFPEEIQVLEEGEDELHKGFKKLILSFQLEKGAYATTVLKNLEK
jgi:tRNA pseudouridine13 synthase